MRQPADVFVDGRVVPLEVRAPQLVKDQRDRHQVVAQKGRREHAVIGVNEQATRVEEQTWTTAKYPSFKTTYFGNTCLCSRIIFSSA